MQTAQAKLDSEINKVVESVKAEYQAALSQENSLIGRPEYAESRSARPEPQGHRVLGALRATPRATSRSTKR